jgi:hypothetical protein
MLIPLAQLGDLPSSCGYVFIGMFLSPAIAWMLALITHRRFPRTGTRWVVWYYIVFFSLVAFANPGNVLWAALTLFGIVFCGPILATKILLKPVRPPESVSHGFPVIQRSDDESTQMSSEMTVVDSIKRRSRGDEDGDAAAK